MRPLMNCKRSDAFAAAREMKKAFMCCSVWWDGARCGGAVTSAKQIERSKHANNLAIEVVTIWRCTFLMCVHVGKHLA